MAYHIKLVARDLTTGESFSSTHIIQANFGGEPFEPDFLSAVEMLHDELIDTEEKADEYCQHR